MAIVYRHIRLDTNEPFYIGVGTSKDRAFRKSYRNKIWNDIYSKSEIKIEILFSDLTKEQAIEKEKEFISYYGRINNGTGSLANLTDGGDNFGRIAWNKGIKVSDEKKQQMSLISKRLGCKPPSRKGSSHTIETRKKMSESHLGQTSWNKGLKLINRKKP
jgi:hypothetical protein